MPKTSFRKNSDSPTAFDVLGRFANDFLIPYWQQLSLKLSGRRFVAGTPDDHLSFTAFRALRWQEVIASIESEENWDNQPVLLFRYAEACFKSNKEAAGLENWFKLFLQFPENAERMVGDTGNFLLLSDWRNFNELDPELEQAPFPACIVLKKPALAKVAVGFDGENTAHRALQLMRDLVACADNGINETTLNLRAKLRQQNPSLFVHYMAAHR